VALMTPHNRNRSNHHCQVCIGLSDCPRVAAEMFVIFLHCDLSHCATALGSNLTHVPTRNEGIRPAAACLKIVTLDTKRSFASSSAVKAWPVVSI
jgi:hypothetical protein